MDSDAPEGSDRVGLNYLSTLLGIPKKEAAALLQDPLLRQALQIRGHGKHTTVDHEALYRALGWIRENEHDWTQETS